MESDPSVDVLNLEAHCVAHDRLTAYRAIQHIYYGYKPVLLMGADRVPALILEQQFGPIVAEFATMIIAREDQCGTNQCHSWLKNHPNSRAKKILDLVYQPGWIFINANVDGYSSTKARKSVQSNAEPSGLCAGVKRYIVENGLYKGR